MAEWVPFCAIYLGCLTYCGWVSAILCHITWVDILLYVGKKPYYLKPNACKISCAKWHTFTHWGRVTRICVGKLTIIVSDNGLSPGRRQAIIWTNARILLIGPSGTNFSEILIEIQTFSSKKIRFKMSSAKCCPFRLGLNVLMYVHILMCFCFLNSHV